MKSPSRFILAVFVIFVALSLALMGTTVTFAGEKASRGMLGNNQLLAYASTSGGGGNSGRIWSAEGVLESLGKVEVLVRASWDWSPWRDSASALDNTEHPSAVVNRTPIKFEGCRTGKICADPIDAFNESIYSSLPIDTTRSPVVFPADHDLNYLNGKVRRGHPDPFVANATVTIMTKNGDEIYGAIVGGSVTEIQVPSPSVGGSVNEWFISFEVDGGTGEFLDASGMGFIHKVFDSGGSGTVYSDTPGVYQDDPDRFLKHDIFLELD